jgi:hypothetical protein
VKRFELDTYADGQTFGLPEEGDYTIQSLASGAISGFATRLMIG